jgi:hypothetical protein
LQASTSEETANCSSDDDAPIASLKLHAKKKRAIKSRIAAAVADGAQSKQSVDPPNGKRPLQQASVDEEASQTNDMNLSRESNKFLVSQEPHKRVPQISEATPWLFVETVGAKSKISVPFPRALAAPKHP